MFHENVSRFSIRETCQNRQNHNNNNNNNNIIIYLWEFSGFDNPLSKASKLSKPS